MVFQTTGLAMGSALLASGEPPAPTLLAMRHTAKPMGRRAAVMCAMAALPIPLTGPSAAALREKLGTPVVAIVNRPDDALVRAVLDGYLRDDAPPVRKALVRLARTWSELCPEAADAWLQSVRGGVPKMLRLDLEKGIKKGRRLAAAD